jgi:proliferating cell nuclear antigen PCNA
MGRLPKHKKQLQDKQYPTVVPSENKFHHENTIELKTGKSHIIKILLECIRQLIHEANIIFLPDSKKNKGNNLKDDEMDRINISICNSDVTVAIDISLDMKEFEHYFCDKKGVVGVNIKDLHTVIKSVGANEILYIYMKKNNYNNLYIVSENTMSKQFNSSTIKTIDISTEGIEFPEIEPDGIVTIASDKLQKIMKDFSNFNTTIIEIVLCDKNLCFNSVDSDICREIIISEGDDISKIFFDGNIDGKTQYRGKFNLEYLQHISKSSQLSDQVVLQFKKGEALFISYNIVDVGEIKFLLDPISD